MKKRFMLTLLIIVFGLAVIPSVGVAIDTESHFASNYNRTYTFGAEHVSYRFTHTLYTSVPPSLYDFYQSSSHRISRDSDYAKFVTPDVVRIIAENMRQAVSNRTRSDEDFANDVLTLVRQIPYSVSAYKYPVETIVENSGDCDVVSFLAASIMKAGGLDVVLLIYRGLPGSHMNVGVCLPYEPLSAPEIEPVGFEYTNKTYWVAECTPPRNWKVGHQPEIVASVKPVIISLKNCEESSPALVSSSLNNHLISSSISITPSLENSNVTEKESPLTISGSISPAFSGKKVVMYVSQDLSSGKILETDTDNFGNYSLTWNVTSTGTYYIRTSLVPFSNYAGSDSDLMTFFVRSHPQEVIWNGLYYEWGSGNIGYKTLSSKNVKDFLKSDLAGANISLSGDFIILKKEQTVTNSRQIITIPERVHAIGIGRGRRLMLTIPEQKVTVQESMQASNHFGFTLQNYNGNYSATVRLLNDSDVFQIEKQFDENNLTFMNASASIKENIWHRVVVKVSGNEITAELRGEHDGLLKEFAVSGETLDGNESGLLISCNPDTFLAFKNLKVVNLDQPPKSVDDVHLPERGLELLVSYVMFLMLLGLVGAAITYLRKGKRVRKAEL
ncbi:hypothetical protein JXA31_08940 [Candidatus Bathyarchaeota archaeon]|nr:hypothetical protein [Candidatus Bathyarchaeota archaeon]